ncbi:MAG: hypothetical protein R2828_35440 [Saprospiraceae bacterium]
MNDVLTIGAQTSLVIDPGVIIKHNDSDWQNMFDISGSIEARSTVDQPIVSQT